MQKKSKKFGWPSVYAVSRFGFFPLFWLLFLHLNEADALALLSAPTGKRRTIRSAHTVLVLGANNLQKITITLSEKKKQIKENIKFPYKRIPETKGSSLGDTIFERYVKNYWVVNRYKSMIAYRCIYECG